MIFTLITKIVRFNSVNEKKTTTSNTRSEAYWGIKVKRFHFSGKLSARNCSEPQVISCKPPTGTLP